jgi:hypothetical protein
MGYLFIKNTLCPLRYALSGYEKEETHGNEKDCED